MAVQAGAVEGALCSIGRVSSQRSTSATTASLSPVNRLDDFPLRPFAEPLGSPHGRGRRTGSSASSVPGTGR